MSSELQRRLREQLEALARQQQTISYRQLAMLTGIQGPGVIQRLTHLLEEMIRQDHAAGIRASVASLAVSQAVPRIPREGYFMLLAELGLYHGPYQGAAAETFHATCIEQVFQCFSP